MYSILSLSIVDCVHASAYDVKSELLNACFKENLLVIKTQFLAAAELQFDDLKQVHILIDWSFVLFLLYYSAVPRMKDDCVAFVYFK